MSPTDPKPVRSLDLNAVFTKRRMKDAWRNAIRPGLRKQPIADLHDFLDVHRNLEPFLERVSTDVVAGRYRPGESEVVRLEKKHGICRRLVLPSPSDALVLQTLVDALEPTIIARSPTQCAYYSRSHRAPSFEQVEIGRAHV